MASLRNSFTAPAPTPAPAGGSYLGGWLSWWNGTPQITHPVFGVPVSTSITNSTTFHKKLPVVERLCAWLEEHAIECEGLLRISGGEATVKNLQVEFNTKGDADLTHASVHDVATLLKRFFSQLPECILLDSLYPAWMAIADLPEHERIMTVRAQITTLPEENVRTLQRLIRFCIALVAHQGVNKMSAQNVAIVLAPSLIFSKDPASLLNFKPTIELTKIFIDHFREIFEEHQDVLPAAIHVHHESPADSSHTDSSPSEHPTTADISSSVPASSTTAAVSPDNNDSSSEPKLTAQEIRRSDGSDLSPSSHTDSPGVVSPERNPPAHAQLAAMLTGALATVNLREPDMKSELKPVSSPILVVKLAPQSQDSATSSSSGPLPASFVKALLTPSSTTPLSVTSAASTPSVALAAPVSTPQEILSPSDTPASFQTPASSMPSSCSSSPPPTAAVRSAHANLLSSLEFAPAAPAPAPAPAPSSAPAPPVPKAVEHQSLDETPK